MGIDRPKRHDLDQAADEPGRRDAPVDDPTRDSRPDALQIRAEQWSRRGLVADIRPAYDWRRLDEEWTEAGLIEPAGLSLQRGSHADTPAARRLEWQAPLARSEVIRVGDGVVDERKREFPAAERRIADYLAAADGSVVAARTEDHGFRFRKPDADVDGVATEFKSLRPVATDATMRGALNSAKGQASHIVVDARDSSLAAAAAWHGVCRFLTAPYSRKVQAIRVIGDDYDLRWKRG